MVKDFSNETEADTRAERIDPKLRDAGWGVVDGSRIRREVICPGRIQTGGTRGTSLSSDYVFLYRDQKLAVLEAKKAGVDTSAGVAQAKEYATRLNAPFAYASNGRTWYEINMRTGTERDVECVPSPDELWHRVHSIANTWRDHFGAIPFETGGGKWQPRYYQHNAITAALEAIALGQTRILLTLATGTGKTGIAFQLAWKLFHSRWNLSGEPTRRPRILFLADRNILANQAFNSFGAFPDDALVRIDPDEIRKQKRVPKNGSIFFTIFQTFMTGDDGDRTFEQYEPDFFDFIIIDECHRGGANNESTWRDILERFSPAVQLGLTATPKRTDNADTYRYFGKPVYQYSLKQGINDGFLTPFRVRQIASTLDEYVFEGDDHVLKGEVADGAEFVEGDFNRKVVIRDRELHRVRTLLSEINQNEKTIVFCASQKHAAMIRDLINQEKSNQHPNYCARVTAEDGALGEKDLAAFQDNEKTIPTILTTSQKLSTGVDAKNVRNIVLMRPVNSMIEFKQIIGRGTRTFDGKDYFTIYDFVKAHMNFQDPAWDGDPADVIVDMPEPREPREPSKNPDEPSGGDGEPKVHPELIEIKLADGKTRSIQNITGTSFWSADGTPMSASEFIQRLYGDLPELFKDEDELRKLWSVPDTRKALLAELSERGYGIDILTKIRELMDAEKSDLFDVLAYISYKSKPVTREMRAENGLQSATKEYDAKLAAFLQFVLEAYVSDGIGELDRSKLPDLLELKYRDANEGATELGGHEIVAQAFVGFQRYLFEG
ncbi:MAG: EcoAI/FtnUII family type I restriction enzme subunit R [Halocynthiibacter sp.]